MILDTKIPLYALSVSLIGLVIAVVRYGNNQFEKTQNAWWPSERKYHIRLVGWSWIFAMLLYALSGYLNYLLDARIEFKIMNTFYIGFGFVTAIAIAFIQHREWIGKPIGRRLKKVSALEGSMESDG